MKKLMLLKHKKFNLFLFTIFYFSCCFIFNIQKNKVWAEDYSPINSFKVTLTIQQTNCPSQHDSIDLVFGLDETESVIYAPPSTPDSCFNAFFDRNYSYMIIDNVNRIDCINWHPNGQGWTETILPFPSETCESWRANWGVKIFLNSSQPASLLISWKWDPNVLIPGPFELHISEQKIDMHENHEIVLENITNQALLEISHSSNEPLSIMSIVCVGGSEEDINSDLNPFLSLGAYAYKIFKNKLPINPKNDIRFIYFDPFYDIDGNNSTVIYSEGLLRPKKVLEKSIIDWTGDRWTNNRPKKAILIIYIVDHGVPIYEENGKVFLDPLNPDWSDRGLTGTELNDWLNQFEESIKNSVIEYEIYIVVEACYSKSFISPLKSENHILIASAHENETAIIIGEEESSFTWFFWDRIEYNTLTSRPLDIWSKTFNDAKEKLYSEITHYQTPYFWSYEDSLLLINKYLSGCGLIDIPIIKNTEIDQEHIDDFTIKSSFTVYADCPIDNAWAAIISPNCTNSYCRFYTNPIDCDCDANHCTFSPDYNFCLPGTKVYIYAKGNDTDVSVPYLVDPNLIVSHIPPDAYEQDDNPYQANLFSEKFQTREFQIHSFHNPNDEDWFKFFILPEFFNYAIELEVPCTLSVDPKVSPFQIEIVTDEERKEVECLKIDPNNPPGNIYYYLWENTDKNAGILNLKVTPSKECCKVFPYKIYIYSADSPGICYIWSKINKYTKNKIKNNIKLRAYCLEKPLSAHWIPLNSIDKNYYCNPEYFYFKLDYPVCSSYSLYIGEEKRGPDIPINTGSFIKLEPNQFFTDTEIPREDCDQDRDIITDPEEIIKGTDPNRPEIILRTGMNLFRYPFWASYPDGNSLKNGINLYEIFFKDDYVDPNIIKIYIYSSQEGLWYPYNQFSSNIHLENKSGCLIYLDSNQPEHVIPLPIKPGLPFEEVLDPDRINIELYPGPNLIGIIGYKAFFGPLMSLSERYLDSHSAIYSLAENSSINSLPGFSSIMKYDNVKGAWQHNSMFFSRVSGEDFPIQANEAFLIYTKGLNELNDPNINLKDPNNTNLNNPDDLKKSIWSPSEISK